MGNLACTGGPWTLSGGSQDSATFLGVATPAAGLAEVCPRTQASPAPSHHAHPPCTKELRQHTGQWERRGRGALSLLLAVLWMWSLSRGHRGRWLEPWQIGHPWTDWLKLGIPGEITLFQHLPGVDPVPTGPQVLEQWWGQTPCRRVTCCLSGEPAVGIPPLSLPAEEVESGLTSSKKSYLCKFHLIAL